MKPNFLQSKRGFALLFAVLISSLLLAIGTTIISATLKNILFSSSGRESQFAFYSADTAAECTLYFDKVMGAFPTSTDALVNIDPEDLKCNGAEATSIVVSRDTLDPHQAATTTFAVSVLTTQNTPGLCATIAIGKSQTDPNDDSTITTNIDARGYNTCDLTNIRRIERGLRINY